MGVPQKVAHVVVMACLILTFATPAFPQEEAEPGDLARILEETKVSLDFRDASLPYILQFLQEQTGLTFVLDASFQEELDPEEFRSTITLADVSVANALRCLLYFDRYTFAGKGGVIVILPEETFLRRQLVSRAYPIRDLFFQKNPFEKIHGGDYYEEEADSISPDDIAELVRAFIEQEFAEPYLSLHYIADFAAPPVDFPWTPPPLEEFEEEEALGVAFEVMEEEAALTVDALVDMFYGVFGEALDTAEVLLGTFGTDYLLLRAGMQDQDRATQFLGELRRFYGTGYLLDCKVLACDQDYLGELTSGGQEGQLLLDPDARKGLLRAAGEGVRVSAIDGYRIPCLPGQRVHAATEWRQCYLQGFDIEVAEKSYAADPVVGVNGRATGLAVRVDEAPRQEALRVQGRAMVTLSPPETAPRKQVPAGEIQLPTLEVAETAINGVIPSGHSLLIPMPRAGSRNEKRVPVLLVQPRKVALE